MDYINTIVIPLIVGILSSLIASEVYSSKQLKKQEQELKQNFFLNLVAQIESINTDGNINEYYKEDFINKITKLVEYVKESQTNYHKELPELHSIIHNIFLELQHIDRNNKIYEQDIEKLLEYKNTIICELNK